MRRPQTAVTDGNGNSSLDARTTLPTMGSELVTTPPRSNTPKQKRLSNTDKAFALRYSTDGLTQVEIAKRLGVTQSSISQWLSQCEDTSVEAGQYFRGKALPTAEKIVKKGKTSDLVKVLQGIGVLAPERSAGLSIVIGVAGDGVNLQVNIGAAEGLSPIESGAKVVSHQAKVENP